MDMVVYQLCKKQISDGLEGAGSIKGDPGITPHIGENGNWYIGDDDTGVPAEGTPGPEGPAGPRGEKGDPGEVTTQEMNAAIESKIGDINSILDFINGETA